MGMHPQSAEVPFIWPGNDSDDDNATTSIYRRIPAMQKFRGNLTALSQVYNLYFCAYQGRIFVYRPRAAPSQALPCQPDLQLKPKASGMARMVGGCLDATRPHTVNNIITGFLGEDEIVLACYDDGDVVAYYTNQIAQRIFTCRDTNHASHKTALRQFFHENVGISAWGLAIHQKSRLIAVSSNRHEVMVFALALQNPPNGRASQSRTSQLNTPKRACNWRIVIRMARSADNIPSVCFIDDCHGNAQRVCAIDIKGTAWLADIWQGNKGPLVIPPLCFDLLRSEEFFPAPSRGWGIFALEERDFLKVKTTEELFGGQPGHVPRVPGCSQTMVNIKNTLKSIPDNPHREPNRPSQPPLPLDPEVLQQGFVVQEPEGLLGNDDSDDMGEEEFEDSEDESEDVEEGDSEEDLEEDDSEEDVESEGSEWTISKHLQANAQGQNIGESMASYPENLNAWDARENSLGMTYWPHNNQIVETPQTDLGMIALLEGCTEPNRHPPLQEADLADLGRKLFLLRTYEKDIELRSFSPNMRWDTPQSQECGVVCPDTLKFGRFRDPRLRHHFHATSRLNMIALAPELSLMAIGSPTGRVVLLTLTRKAIPAENSHGEGTLEHGFRVEWVLPTGSDEDEHRKILRPMHGMALGPVQTGDGIGAKVGGEGPAMPRRYRLMLHYRNHDILSYELTREEQTGKLCIF
ncbi:hypothetical protein F66182_9360 [Fusarium sp. NRRL 66182]|nr:hypothetical protein F66182_9360 [Fusarium sp. NRRL 66182]